MKRPLSLLVAVAAFVLAGTGLAQEKQATGKKWTCAVTTEGAQLIWSMYNGGDWANIHIAPFNRPGSYKVIKEGEDTAKGETSNGTKFTCKLA